MADSTPDALRIRPYEATRLRRMIRAMSRDSAVYKLLKEELTARGYWKNLPRGRHIKRVLPSKSVSERANTDFAV